MQMVHCVAWKSLEPFINLYHIVAAGGITKGRVPSSSPQDQFFNAMKRGARNVCENWRSLINQQHRTQLAAI